MIWFSSDMHYGHANVLKLCNRPFANIDEMNTVLINNYNAVVKEDDEVYILGDVAYRSSANQVTNILRRLNKSRRYLIIGNHDHKNLKDPSFRMCFDWIKDYHEINYNKQLYVMSHYPFASWRGSGHGSIMIHGHCHSKMDNSKYYRIDVGVDNPICGFSPISIDRIESIMKNKKAEIVY